MEGGREISLFSLLLDSGGKDGFLVHFFVVVFSLCIYFYICPVMISAGREEERCSVGPAVICVCFSILR